MLAYIALLIVLLNASPLSIQFNNKLSHGTDHLRNLQIAGFRGLLTCEEQLADLRLQYRQKCTLLGGPPPDCAKGCPTTSKSCADACNECKVISELYQRKRQECDR